MTSRINRILEAATAAVLAAIILAGGGLVWAEWSAQTPAGPGDLDGHGAELERPVDPAPPLSGNGRG